MAKHKLFINSRLTVCVVGVLLLVAGAVTAVARESTQAVGQATATQSGAPVAAEAQFAVGQPSQVDIGPDTEFDDAFCTECHDPTTKKPTLAIYQTRHGVQADARAPKCQSCHGLSAAHVKDAGKPSDVPFDEKLKNVASSEMRNGMCLQCHEGQARTNWLGSQHETADLACSSCHNIHDPEQKLLSAAGQAETCFACHKTQRAQVHRISAHPLAGKGLASEAKMSCSDCHNPHGSTGPNLMVKDSINETCFACHGEKRGPYLWEHSPVSDNCTHCHTPHGSAIAPLLKTRQPALCQDCHSGDHANQIQSGANLTGGGITTLNGVQQAGAAATRQQMVARGCINCHSYVHGSNHPAGAKFIR